MTTKVPQELLSGGPELLGVHGSDVASAATINLNNTTGDCVDVTGTATITAITLAEGERRTVRFTGALTLTHGASLVLPGGASITTAAGDYAVFRGYASSVVRCELYMKSSGAPIALITAAMLASSLDLSGKTLTMPTGLLPWTYGSQVATTSGTTAELLVSMPDTAREVEVMLAGVSTGTANQPPLLQLGDAGGYETSGYVGEVSIIQGANPNESAVTDGFSLARATNFAAADLITGVLRLSRWDVAEHQWLASGQFITEGTIIHSVCGYKTTSQAMDRIRLTTTGGAATFDAGEARVRWR